MSLSCIQHSSSLVRFHLHDIVLQTLSRTHPHEDKFHRRLFKQRRSLQRTIPPASLDAVAPPVYLQHRDNSPCCSGDATHVSDLSLFPHNKAEALTLSSPLTHQLQRWCLGDLRHRSHEYANACTNPFHGKRPRSRRRRLNFCTMIIR